MPKVFDLGPYTIYFWVGEGNPLEPVHVHVTEGLRRFGWTTGTRTRAASSDCIVRTVSFGPNPLKNGKGASLIPQSADSLLVEFPDGNVTISTFALFNRTSYMHILQILPLKDDLMRTFYTFEAIRGAWIETGSCSGGRNPLTL